MMQSESSRDDTNLPSVIEESNPSHRTARRNVRIY